MNYRVIWGKNVLSRENSSPLVRMYLVYLRKASKMSVARAVGREVILILTIHMKSSQHRS